MHIVLHVWRDAQGRPVGSLAPAQEGQLALSFSGWLELMSVLDRLVPSPDGAPGTGADGAAPPRR